MSLPTTALLGTSTRNDVPVGAVWLRTNRQSRCSRPCTASNHSAYRHEAGVLGRDLPALPPSDSRFSSLWDRTVMSGWIKLTNACRLWVSRRGFLGLMRIRQLIRPSSFRVDCSSLVPERRWLSRRSLTLPPMGSSTFARCLVQSASVASRKPRDAADNLGNSSGAASSGSYVAAEQGPPQVAAPWDAVGRNPTTRDIPTVSRVA